MWMRPSPSKIPGTPIRIVRLPRDHICPNCHLPFRKVEQVQDGKTGKVSNRCPHCGWLVKVKID